MFKNTTVGIAPPEPQQQKTAQSTQPAQHQEYQRPPPLSQLHL
jgi:hypothetical protein